MFIYTANEAARDALLERGFILIHAKPTSQMWCFDRYSSDAELHSLDVDYVVSDVMMF